MKLNKKTLAALAVTALLSGTAMAETGFTIYGRANVSVEQQKVGSQSDSVMVDNASRFGVRANRDLSDGMSVGAVLEAGTNFTNGATKTSTDANGNVKGSKFFAREATVALNGAFGQVKLGRMPASVAYFATADYVSNHNHDTGTSSDALYDFLATGSLSNAVGYTSPKLGALKLEAQYGLKKATGTGTSDSTNVSPIAMAASYDAGALQLALGYESAQNPTTTAAVSASQVTARAFYTMGPLGFGGYVQKSSGTNFDRTASRLSAMYTLGQNEFHVNFGSAGNRAGVANTGASQYTLGYNYNLDKQTKVYAMLTQVSNKAAAGYNPGGFATANSNGQDLRSVGAGVRYNF
jgi:predicted porin